MKITTALAEVVISCWSYPCYLLLSYPCCLLLELSLLSIAGVILVISCWSNPCYLLLELSLLSPAGLPSAPYCWAISSSATAPPCSFESPVPAQHLSKVCIHWYQQHSPLPSWIKSHGLVSCCLSSPPGSPFHPVWPCLKQQETNLMVSCSSQY